MIKNKAEYKYFLSEDLKRTGLENNIRVRLLDRRYKFYRSLRRTEYFTNCKKDFLGKLFSKILRIRHSKLCDKYNWTIPINVFEEGLAIVHVGTIVVNGDARIGKNCRINACTNIGRASIHGGQATGAPILGDNVYIAPGAKIFGPIVIGDNTAIGANAVVNKSFEDGNYTIAGIPARIISMETSKKFIL